MMWHPRSVRLRVGRTGMRPRRGSKPAQPFRNPPPANKTDVLCAATVRHLDAERPQWMFDAEREHARKRAAIYGA